jgi:aspartate/methionine/tyrosine aminotransferase
MKIARFAMERYQSTWENAVQFNLSESGVHPITLSALVDHTWIEEVLAREQLGYGSTRGSAELRTAIAGLYHAAGPEHVLVTTGAAEANFLVTWALLDRGDEAVVMLPNYMQIPQLAQAWGAEVKAWWLRPISGRVSGGGQWTADIEELTRLVSPKTKAICVCNPNNPTGAVLSVEAMNAVCAAAARVGAWVVADEVYRGAELDGHLTPSFWGRSPKVIVAGGLSKGYGLPGLRVGWVVAPHEMVELLWSYRDYTTIAPSILSDQLARIALGPQASQRLATRTRLILNENLPIVARWIDGLDELVGWIPPKAGAIALLKYTLAINSTDLATRLRKQHDVLIVPGDHFQMDGYLRIGYGGEAHRLEEALRRTGECLRTV